MNFKDFYFGKRDFKSKNDIIEWIKKSSNYNIDGDELLDGANAILLYKTVDRKSWIVKTNKRIYKILDDRLKENPIINWSEDKNKFRKMKIQTITVKDGLGRIIFPNQSGKKYYFDENLFQDKDIDQLLKK